MSQPAKSSPLRDITSSAKHAQAMQISSSSCSSTEEVDGNQEEWEALVREETKNWLDLHGAKLFALEASKFNAAEAKRKNVRSAR